jgi:nitroimidazol reductase NimA-like FMN-containing flavoprotein (pyridoxamine 5'-phosphate oxidase superfamily)
MRSTIGSRHAVVAWEVRVMNEVFDIHETELEEDLCWRMIARAGFGRVAFVDDDGVAVLPVNAAVHDHRLIFRTRSESSLARVAGATVGFEADHTDRVSESGWSVVVRGTLVDVTDSPEVEHWDEYSVHPWAPPPRDRWMMIEPSRVTGRLIERHRRLEPDVRVPYMAPD